MGEKNITLGPGKLYINDEPFGGISEASLEAVEPEEPHEPVRLSAPGEFTATIELDDAAFAAFQESVRLATEKWEHLIKKYINQLLNECPNRRVAHLVIHAKKAKVRKKNWKRVLKYATKKGDTAK